MTEANNPTDPPGLPPATSIKTELSQVMAAYRRSFDAESWRLRHRLAESRERIRAYAGLPLPAFFRD